MGKKGSKLSKDDIKELEGCTYFPAPQLQKWYKDFIRDCPTGFMSKVEFANIYGQFFPSRNPGRFVDYVFNVFDVNKDGVITFKEFIRAISVATKGTMEEKLNWAFNLYDLDNDGYISQPEMLDIVRAIYQLHGKQHKIPQHLHFHQPAKNIKDNNDAKLEDAVDSPERRVGQLFAKLDLNQDGMLSREEFCKGFKNDPWIAKALLGGLPSDDQQPDPSSPAETKAKPNKNHHCNHPEPN